MQPETYDERAVPQSRAVSEGLFLHRIRCQDLSGAAMDALLRQPGDIHFVDSYACVVRTEDRAR